MRKNLLLILTVITFSANAQTSIYHPFPDSNAVWNFHFILYCTGGYGDEYYSVTISGDTIINSQTYHKLETPFIQSFTTGTCPGNAIGYNGAIRQDTTNRKVFYVPPSNNTEQLLYDFSMQVGDTVQGYIESFASPNDTVQSIDSVLVGSNYRKRWNINSCYNIHFIEGIGSTYGLIKLSPGCIVDHADYSLTCFMQNGQTLYPDTTTNCELITSVESIFARGISTMVFPNPTSGNSFITYTLSTPATVSIALYDVLGNKLQQLVNGDQQQGEHNATLDTDKLASGVYVLQIRAGDQMAEEKIVVMN
jgi:Secretion system C-terminal sorting domain